MEGLSPYDRTMVDMAEVMEEDMDTEDMAPATAVDMVDMEVAMGVDMEGTVKDTPEEQTVEDTAEDTLEDTVAEVGVGD